MTLFSTILSINFHRCTSFTTER